MMITMSMPVDQRRRRAAELRTEAEAATDATHRAHLLALAKSYEEIAGFLEGLDDDETVPKPAVAPRPLLRAARRNRP